MQLLTKEEIKKLKKIEDMLLTAVKSKTATGYTDDIWCLVYPIYFRLFKHRMSQSCNYCKLTVLRAVGEVYMKEVLNGNN